MTARALWPVAMALVAASAAHAQSSYRTIVESRRYAGERDLTVDVEFAVGHVRLVPGDPGALYRLSLVYDEETFRPDIRYRETRNRLDAGVESRHDIEWHRRSARDQRLDLSLSPDVALDLRMALGAADADVDLGGLSLVNGKITTGASETTVRFGEPNRTECETLRFEVGAARFAAERLANARCRRIEVTGGVAEVVLDFSGAALPERETRVSIDIGLGNVRLRFPEDVGVRLTVDRFLAGLDHSGFVRHGSGYVSRNYDTASTFIEVDVDAALGSIDIDWIR